MGIYFDLDGVLAKFMFGTPFANLYRKGYFENLPPQMNIVMAAKSLAKQEDVFILSAYLEDSRYALEEKKRWIKAWLPEIPESNWMFLPCGQSKGDFVTSPGDILLDDRRVHGKEWTNSSGKFIKVSKNKEDAIAEKKNYQYVISPDMCPEEILRIVERRKHA